MFSGCFSARSATAADPRRSEAQTDAGPAPTVRATAAAAWRRLKSAAAAWRKLKTAYVRRATFSGCFSARSRNGRAPRRSEAQTDAGHLPTVRTTAAAAWRKLKHTAYVRHAMFSGCFSARSRNGRTPAPIRGPHRRRTRATVRTTAAAAWRRLKTHRLRPPHVVFGLLQRPIPQRPHTRARPPPTPTPDPRRPFARPLPPRGGS